MELFLLSPLSLLICWSRSLSHSLVESWLRLGRDALFIGLSCSLSQSKEASWLGRDGLFIGLSCSLSQSREVSWLGRDGLFSPGVSILKAKLALERSGRLSGIGGPGSDDVEAFDCWLSCRLKIVIHPYSPYTVNSVLRGHSKRRQNIGMQDR